MSKGPWKDVCSLSGFSVKHLDNCNLPDHLQTLEGGIDPSYFFDSDIFNINTLAFEAGFVDTQDFKKRILPSSIWHAHQVQMRDDDGKLLGVLLATHVNSARAGGEIWRNKVKAEQRNRARSMNFWTRNYDAHVHTNVSSLID